MTSPETGPPSPPLAPLPVPAALLEFLRTEAAGGIVLVVAAVVALGWANSPWRAGYESLWATEIAVRAGRFGLVDDLRHWVNECLMALFFLVVGLEIKRELVVGELQSWRTAALPAVAALGGMAVPAALYAAVNAGGAGSRGWAIPMATDVAFALGVVALVGSRVPGPLKVFLLTLAIVDDIGAVVVIAAFYSRAIHWPALAVAAGLVGILCLLRKAGVRSLAPFAVVGVGLWVAVFQSGIHATMAGVALGLLAPARPAAGGDAARDSVAERLEHQLHPWASLLIVPLFALANAGVPLDTHQIAARGAARVTIGVVVGLVAGKLVGVTGFAWLAVRLRLCPLPREVGWAQMVGIAGVAGVGFTVSVFVADLAFEPVGLRRAAKIGVLVASVAASALGAGLLWLAPAHRSSSG